jgi:hypothetical protein
MLLVLLLGIADFGRVFAAGITIEAAARNAAEAAAQEYVQVVRNDVGGTLDTSDYSHLHDVALKVVCQEAETLPNQSASSGACEMPITAVCVHDGLDPDCGIERAGSPSKCHRLNDSWSNANLGATPSGAPAMPYVEVRVCYQFTTLFNLTDLNLPFGWSLDLGDIFLERDREFTVACYQQSPGACR